MRSLFLFIFVCVSVEISAKSFTDMAGRTVVVPDNIERILPYDSKTSILLFPVAYEKMVAKALLPGSNQYHLIADTYNQMPELDVKNIESVLESNAQVIIAGVYLSSDSFERFDKMQKRTNIPVVLIDLSIDKLDKTYQFLAEFLEQKAQCIACAEFLQSVYKRTHELVNQNPLLDAGIYYTIGASGLMTDPSGSKHTEVFDYLTLNNVAKVAIPTGGHANVNMEQVIIWNPMYIFCAGFKGNKNAYNTIVESSMWATIAAVQNDQIYKVPSQPFGWFDHPPSVNRIPGIIWLSKVFYKLPEVEMKGQIIKFYKLFYRYELNDVEYNKLFED